MRIDHPPYWYWGLDRWNVLVAVGLLVAAVLVAVSGGAPQLAVVTPTITQPAAGAALNYASPGAIVGRTAPGAVVRIFDGDTLLGETTADRAGYYRFSLPALASGPHTLTARVYDAKGNLIASSVPVAVTVVGGPAVQASPTPAGPKPTTEPPTFTGLASGAQLTGDKPGMLTGTAAPGSKIQVFANDKQIGEAIAGSDGKWSLALPALAPGAYTLVARMLGPDGAVVGESAPLKVTVIAGGATVQATATLAPSATATTKPTATVTVVPPTFAGLTDGGQLPAGKPGELTGTAAPAVVSPSSLSPS
jgi:hypothetical protein